MKKSGYSDLTKTSLITNSATPSFASQVKRYRWAIAWCLFHVCALILSYKEVRFFNATGEPKTEKFWPLVKFTYPYFLPNDNTTYFKFNGFFTQYDWSEFSFYVGSVIFLIVLVHVYKKSE
jgi:hypothetical protein